MNITKSKSFTKIKPSKVYFIKISPKILNFLEWPFFESELGCSLANTDQKKQYSLSLLVFNEAEDLNGFFTWDDPFYSPVLWNVSIIEIMLWKFHPDSCISILCIRLFKVHWVILSSISDCVSFSVILKVIENSILVITSPSSPHLLNIAEKDTWYLNLFWFINYQKH